MGGEIKVCALCCGKWSCAWVTPNRNGHYFIVCSTCSQRQEAEEQ